MPKVDFREEVANVALSELLEQRGPERGTLRGERGRREGDEPQKRLPSMSQADGCASGKALVLGRGFDPHRPYQHLLHK